MSGMNIELLDSLFLLQKHSIRGLRSEGRQKAARARQAGMVSNLFAESAESFCSMRIGVEEKVGENRKSKWMRLRRKELSRSLMG